MEPKGVVLLLLLFLKSVPTGQSAANQDCYEGNGESYRGSVATTLTGRECQPWASMAPHQHQWTAEAYPNSDLRRNYCRNPSQDPSPWCYTTDPQVRWEYCNLIRCPETPSGVLASPGIQDASEPVPTEQSAVNQDCYEGNGESYRGSVATTLTGRECQPWVSMAPHQHKWTAEAYPNSDLRRNYCRNPSGDPSPWCYTTDPQVRWEYCNLTRCPETPSSISESPGVQDASEPVPTEQSAVDQDCYEGNGESYRGSVATTLTGRKCQPWSSMAPHQHQWTVEAYPNSDLTRNYCRNPSKDPSPWCYTTDPQVRWEYCNLTRCPETPSSVSESPGVQDASEPVPTEQSAVDQDCYEGNGESYRGSVATTLTGRKCQPWAAMAPHQHQWTADAYPNSDLRRNYCRNPSRDPSPWCYTTDPQVRWEYCNLTRCPETPSSVSESPGVQDASEPVPTEQSAVDQDCYEGNGESYRGRVATTLTGRECQPWASMAPHQHKWTADVYPNSDLRRNYCRNPSRDPSPWCYTTDPQVRWEYCNLTRCPETLSSVSESPGVQDASEPVPTGQSAVDQDCYEGNGESYRGRVATTLTGRKCQPWASMAPHQHQWTADAYPNSDLRRNYCRNPSRDPSPWCYTTDPQVRWEYCNLTRCPETPSSVSESPGVQDASEPVPTGQSAVDQDCYEGNGESYRGRVATTLTGRKCQPWASMAPHQHKWTADVYPNSDLRRNYCRNPSRDPSPWCYTTDPQVRWEYCNLTRCPETPSSVSESPGIQDASEPVPTGQSAVDQDCYEGNGESYRGRVATTLTGRKCQPWASMAPHQHQWTADAYPNSDLRRNYCRNPSRDPSPWCYTTDPQVRWEYCNLTRCPETPSSVSESPGIQDASEPVPTGQSAVDQGCYEGNGESYRGRVATTLTGRKCQPWASMAPHQHQWTADVYPNSDLRRNYCRNPSRDPSPWCYTTDPQVRWEYCNLTRCPETPSSVSESPGVQDASEPVPTGQSAVDQDCYEGNGESYRGRVATTLTGRKCQPWASMAPHQHQWTADAYPNSDLRRNYCRNPSKDPSPWCYTTDPQVRWEYCNLTRCPETPSSVSESPGIQDASEPDAVVQDCYEGNGESYRGRVATTLTGRECQPWASMAPHQHKWTAEAYPNSDLRRNYCRNPSRDPIPWCYTTDPQVRWEYCNLTRCPETPSSVSDSASVTQVPSVQDASEPEECVHGNGASYRGKVAVTESGLPCQQWRLQTPHRHSRTPENYRSAHLEANYCRNPDGERRPWCYTTDVRVRWEHCRIPVCQPPPPPNATDECLQGNGESYRGKVAVTASGLPCQHWRHQIPHWHNRIPENFRCQNLDENYCRNPDGAAAPWCYTTDSGVRWEYCSIPPCDSAPHP